MAKQYSCPYCSKRTDRAALIKHIDKTHQEILPDGFTSTQVVFNLVNKTTGGKCRVCGGTTAWREDIGRYDVLCKNPMCKQKMRDEYKKNMLRVKGTYNILNDPDQQAKMLAGRSISGEYQFQDGGKVMYTGTYEKKCLEFMDVVMQIKSEDIISPGPSIEYIYNGEKHIYIPDFYYVPYNLIIEVKDGGLNPNTKESPGMRSSRERTIEKERMITDKGVYNYIRLTDNNFQQLLEVFMEIKLALTENDPKKIVKVNESLDYFFESNSKDEEDEVPEEIKEFLKELNSYDYGYIDKSGKKVKGMSKFFEEYKSLSIGEFERNKIGVCWDYVHYEAEWFSKHGYKHEEFYIQVQDEDNDCPSHTYLVFYLKGDNKPYYFESSWGKFQGIEKFDNETKLHDEIKKRHIENAQSKCDPKSYFREKYDAKSKSWEGLSCGEYMHKISKGRISYEEGTNLMLEFQAREINSGKRVPKSISLYHGSPVQGLKFIEPRECQSYKGSWVFVSPDIRFAACYGAFWHDGIASQGSWDNWQTVVMGISDKVEMNKPCSLYEVENDGSFIDFRSGFKEAVSNHRARVIKETKFNSYAEMLEYYRVKVVSYDKYKRGVKTGYLEESKKEGNFIYLDLINDRSEVERYSKENKMIAKYDQYAGDYNGEVIIDVDKDIVAGQILIGNKKDKGFITDLFINHQCRNNGLGGKLIDDAVKKYGGVDLTVKKDNEIAIRMYKKRGFVIVGDGNNKNEWYMKLKSKLSKDEKPIKESTRELQVFYEGADRIKTERFYELLKQRLAEDNKPVKQEVPLSDINEDDIKDAFNSVIHTIIWCRMDSSAFACFREYKTPAMLDSTSFVAGEFTGNDECINEIIETVNKNSLFKHGRYEAQLLFISEPEGNKIPALKITIKELWSYITVKESGSVIKANTSTDLEWFMKSDFSYKDLLPEDKREDEEESDLDSVALDDEIWD